jgi:hypothetical protein
MNIYRGIWGGKKNQKRKEKENQPDEARKAPPFHGFNINSCLGIKGIST